MASENSKQEKKGTSRKTWDGVMEEIIRKRGKRGRILHNWQLTSQARIGKNRS